MSGDVFLDSNVVIYTLDALDERRETALRLVSAGGVISAQVLSETANVARPGETGGTSVVFVVLLAAQGGGERA